MSMQKLTLRPGINVQRTPLLNEGGWSSANLVRFREGLPETIGGWTSFSTTIMQGICRGLHPWTTLASVQSLGAGTNLRLYVFQGGQGFDITPLLQTTTPTNPYTTTTGSSIVTVVDVGLTVTLTVGSYVEITGGAAVSGLTLAGEYTVQTIISPTSYTILAVGTAAGNVTGGGTPTLQYLLPVGLSNSTLIGGWGVAGWGTGTWGTPRTGSIAVTFARTWTLDNFGEQLIACPRGSGIYVWLPSGGIGVRAVPITNAPKQCNSVFVSNAAEQIIALGAIPAAGGNFDPMLVAWCDYGNYNVWLASSTNAAGSYPLQDGSQLMWGDRAGQQNLIWSDTALYSMQFIGGTLIYGFTQLGTGCGLIGPAAAAVAGVRAFWMSGLNFMQYNGVVTVLECELRDAVFGNLNTAQVSKVVCSINTQFSEVRWDYPSASATENDSYVIYNYADSNWTIGGNGATGIVISRTAWTDFSVFGFPLAADLSGNIWLHENGYTAAGSALPWFIESGEIDLAQGEQIMFCDQLIPDQVLKSGSVAVSVRAQRYPNDPLTLAFSEPYKIVPTTQYISLRLRGRQLSVRFDNSFLSVGNFWRLGALRARVAPDGRN